MTNTNGWDEYKLLVIAELERANIRLDTVDKRLSKIENSLTILQTKSKIAAACIALVVSGGLTLLLHFL